MSVPEPIAEAVEILNSPNVTREIIESADLTLVHANDWNPNRQDDRTYEATRESIREFGFIDPLTVWPHRELEGEWEAIDGEHRLRGALDEGITKGDLIVLRGLTLDQAQRLTVIMNETRGDADVALLGKLMSGLYERLGGDMAKLAIALPYSHYELKHLVEIGQVDWDGFSQETTPRQQPERGNKHAVVLDFDEEQRGRWDLHMGIYLRESEDEDLTAEKVALDLLTAEVAEKWASEEA